MMPAEVRLIALAEAKVAFSAAVANSALESSARREKRAFRFSSVMPSKNARHSPFTSENP